MSAVATNPQVDPGLPLALSARSEEPHYDAEIATQPIVVLLDGELQRCVVSYDVVAGIVRRTATDAAGRKERGRDGKLLVEEVRGRVVVRWLHKVPA